MALSRRSFTQLLAASAIAPAALTHLSPRGAAQDGDHLKVVASFSILADWAKQVGGDHVDVASIVPADGDAHTFDPNPSTVASIADADVIFTIGPSFDGWMDDVIASSGTDATVVAMMEALDVHEPRHAGHDDHADDDHDDDHADDEHAEGSTVDDGHDHGDDDPHIWGDAMLAAAAADVIGATLAEADPGNADAYAANTDAYVAELEELDGWIHEQVGSIPQENRKIVTSHDTLRYYAAAYGFEIIGTALGSLSTESGDPSAGDIAALVGQIEEAGVPAIFAENVMNPNLMQAIADEAGVELAPPLYSDALSGPDGDAATYIDLMRANTSIIVTALGGD
jgi:zinc/manganese transport system substrate-binding protein